jgi:membrane-bound lytic murein transglycosylase D
MRFRRVTILLIAMCSLLCFNTNTYAQLFKSKKQLTQENAKLRKTIDSLKNIIGEGEIEIADTTDAGDSINPGGIGLIENDLFETKTPGSNPDSLLSIWYLQKQLTVGDMQTIDLDSVNFTTNIPDEVYIEKIKKMNSFIPIPYNKSVKNGIILYTEKRPRLASIILGLSSYYLPIFEDIFESYGLPRELTVLAIIESALNPMAVSPTNARGMWQFMRTTARQYGLEINSYVDERLDPVKSATAAAKYLRDAYMIFGDWSLAIASYNCGTGNVNKAIRRAGCKDFWSVYGYLPRETRGYIPNFVGALYLLNYYRDYNIVPEKITLPAHVDTFRIHKNLHFEQISDNIGIPVEELRQLNPQYLHDIIPGSEEEYILNLPYNYTVPFVDKEQQIYAYKDSIFFNPIVYNNYKKAEASGGDDNETVSSARSNTPRQRTMYHKVRRGETLGGIARKYGVTITQVKKWNHMRKNTVQAGKSLVIYKGGKGGGESTYESHAASEDTYIPGSRGKKNSARKSGVTNYTVRRGDTLFSIARKYDMTLSDLLRLNGLSNNSKIFPGRKIKVKRG